VPGLVSAVGVVPLSVPPLAGAALIVIGSVVAGAVEPSGAQATPAPATTAQVHPAVEPVSPQSCGGLGARSAVVITWASRADTGWVILVKPAVPAAAVAAPAIIRPAAAQAAMWRLTRSSGGRCRDFLFTSHLLPVLAGAKRIEHDPSLAR